MTPPLAGTTVIVRLPAWFVRPPYTTAIQVGPYYGPAIIQPRTRFINPARAIADDNSPDPPVMMDETWRNNLAWATLENMPDMYGHPKRVSIHIEEIEQA